MGMQNLPTIVSQLIAHGRPPNTPVAVIKDGTEPHQKTVIGSLTDIVDKVTEQHITAPAVIVVGEVVKLRDKLSWFDNRPLFGKRILVTRARQQASTLSKALSECGALPVELPAIEIQPIPDPRDLDRAICSLQQYQWLVFTSVNGVESFFQRLHKLNLDSRALHSLRIGAIGPATARALETRGIIVDYLPEVYTSQGFITGLESWDITGQRFLLPRADIADKELIEGINRLGGEAYEIAAYRTVPATDAISRAREMLLSDEIDVITFTSSSTVSNLLTAFGGKQPMINSAKVACIGPKTADAAIQAGLKVDILAEEHTIPGLVAAIEHYFGEEG